MTETEDCDCSEEYGPCEAHGELVVQREGAAVRTADELHVQYLDDARDTVPDCLSPYGQHLLWRAHHNLDRSRGGWFSNGALGDETRDVVSQVETELAVAGFDTFWDDGYRIVKVTGGPLAEADQ